MPDAGGPEPRTQQSLPLQKADDRRRGGAHPDLAGRADVDRGAQALESFVSNCETDLVLRRTHANFIQNVAVAMLIAPVVCGLLAIAYVLGTQTEGRWAASLKVIVSVLPCESIGLILLGHFRLCANEIAHLRGMQMTMSARLAQAMFARSSGDARSLADALWSLGSVDANPMLPKGMSTVELERNRGWRGALQDGLASFRRSRRRSVEARDTQEAQVGQDATEASRRRRQGRRAGNDSGV